MKKLITLFLCLILVNLVSAQDLFVDKDGVGGGTCNDSFTKAENDLTHPWCTINKSAIEATAGDTVYIRQGTYNEDSGVDCINDGSGRTATLSPRNNGTQGNPITFKGYPEDVMPILQGNDYARYAACPNGRSYVTIEGLELTKGHMGIRFSSGHNLTIKNNKIHDNKGRTYNNNFAGLGIFFNNDGDATNIIIEDNELYDNIDGDGPGLNVSQILVYSCNTCTIRNNHIYGASGTNGIFIKGQVIGSGWNGMTEDMHIYGNTIHGVQTAIRMRHQGPFKDFFIYNNIIYDSDVGIHVHDDAISLFPSTNMNIYNNTIDGAGKAVGFSYKANYGDINIFNNILYNCLDSYCSPDPRPSYGWYNKPFAKSVNENDTTVNHFLENNNLIYTPGGSGILFCWDTPKTLAQWRSYWMGKGIDNGTNTISVDPLFVNAAAHDYHLQSNSLAIDAGTDMGLPYSGSNPDIGAFEFTGADTTPPIRSNGSPAGILPSGTTSATISLTTNENATCKYSTTASVSYTSMTNTFTTTGATSHLRNLTGLTDGSTYNYYVKCRDTTGNANNTNYLISFSVASGSVNVLFEDDFESGDFSAWTEADAPTSIVSENCYKGNYCALRTFPNPHRNLEVVLDETFDEAYLSFWVKFSPDFTFAQPWTPGVHFVRFWKWIPPYYYSSDHMDSGWGQNNGNFGFMFFRNNAAEVSSYYIDQPFSNDLWQHVEVYFKFNNAGQSNGVFRWWLDNQLMVEDTSAILRSGSTTDLIYDVLAFTNYDHGNDPSEYYYLDDVQLLSTMPNITPDTTPPAAVTNLSVSNCASSSCSLSWTSPGDDGSTGTATQYDIRYSTSTITSTNWNSATQATGEPNPLISGTTQTFNLTGLNADTTYYFALKTLDEVPNTSELSNIPSATTQTSNPLPNILFEEDFENNSFGARGWFDSTSGILSVTEHIPESTASFECKYLQGAQKCQGTAMRHLFEETEKVYVSYYVKYSSNWQGSNLNYNPHEFVLTTNLDDQWVGFANTYMTAYIEQNEGTPKLFIQDSQNVDDTCILYPNDSFVGCNGNFDTYNFTENRSVAACNGPKSIANRDCFAHDEGYWYSIREWSAGNVYFSDTPEDYYKNDWHFIQVLFEMNSISNGIGIADGKTKYWFDGQLIIDDESVLFRTGQNPNMKFIEIALGNWMGQGSPIEQTMWIDNLKISTQPITGEIPTQCTNGQTRDCTTTQGCDGIETCVNETWSSCIDVPNDNCPSTCTPGITVDSTYSGYSSSVIDDEITNAYGGTLTTWATEESTTQPHWIEIEYCQDTTVNSVDVWWAFNDYRQSFMTSQEVQIQYWNGSSFQTTATIIPTTNNEENSSVSFSSATAPRFRLYQPTGMGTLNYSVPGGILWLTEIELSETTVTECNAGESQPCLFDVQENCWGTQTCVNEFWGSCVDLPNDNCPVTLTCADGELINESCYCGESIFDSGYCCAGTQRSTPCPTDCSEGEITSECYCGTELFTTGYCCSEAWQVDECVIPCEEDWSCENWSTCLNGSQSRTCTDLSECGQPDYDESQSCGDCTNGEIQDCTLSNCPGTQLCENNLWNACIDTPDDNCPACENVWVCSAWSSCLNGNQTRTCSDDADCGNEEGKPSESQSCGDCTNNATTTCFTSQGCQGTQTCSNNTWSSCVDNPNDGCPSNSTPGPTLKEFNVEINPVTKLKDGQAFTLTITYNGNGLQNTRVDYANKRYYTNNKGVVTLEAIKEFDSLTAIKTGYQKQTIKLNIQEFECGNGVCEAGENENTCSQDCLIKLGELFISTSVEGENLTVTVTGANGKPVGDVQVVYGNETKRTNSLGITAFTELDGTQTIEASKIEYQTKTITYNPSLVCEEGTKKDCTIKDCLGTQTCENGKWSSCNDVPEDGCPAGQTDNSITAILVAVLIIGIIITVATKIKQN